MPKRKNRLILLLVQRFRSQPYHASTARMERAAAQEQALAARASSGQVLLMQIAEPQPVRSSYANLMSLDFLWGQPPKELSSNSTA